MPPLQGLQLVQGTGVEMYSAQPGLVSSPLYSKGDHRKGTMWAVEFSQSFYGQAQSEAAGAFSELPPTLNSLVSPS